MNEEDKKALMMSIRPGSIVEIEFKPDTLNHAWTIGWLIDTEEVIAVKPPCNLKYLKRRGVKLAALWRRVRNRRWRVVATYRFSSLNLVKFGDVEDYLYGVRYMSVENGPVIPGERKRR